MTDIASLNLLEPDPLDWDHLELGGEGVPPVPDGKYLLQSPATIDFDSAKGRLRAILSTLVIVGPTHQGEKLGRHWISTKRYDKRNSSAAAEYFAACGLTSQPRTNQEYQALFLTSANCVWEAIVQQRAFCNHKETPFAAATPFSVEGESRMVLNGQPLSSCPTCQKRVYINSQVRRFIPAATS